MKKKPLLLLATTAMFLSSCSTGSVAAEPKGIEIKVDNGYIKYQVEGSNDWKNIIAVTELKGADGQNGNKGADATAPVVTIGTNGNWYVDGVDTGKPSKGENGQSAVAPVITIGANGNWFVDGNDIGKPSRGENGQSAVAPVITIGANGNWFVDGNDIGKPSRGDIGPEGPEGGKGDTGDKGDKGDKGDTGVSVINSRIKTFRDIAGIETKYLVLTMSDGSTQQVAIEKNAAETFYDEDAGDNAFLGYFPAKPDGKCEGKLTYEIEFNGFQGAQSQLKLPFELAEEDIIGYVDFSRVGYYEVQFKRFDGKVLNGFIEVYADDNFAIDVGDAHVINKYFPKTSSADEIPDVYVSWFTPNNEYRYRKLKPYELEGIDFTVPGKKEITHVFTGIFEDIFDVLPDEERFINVYDPENITCEAMSVAFEPGNDNDISAGEEGVVGVIGVAYDYHPDGTFYFSNDSNIKYSYSDGRNVIKRLSVDDFVAEDVQAVMNAQAAGEYSLRFKTNTGCSVRVLVKEKAYFDEPFSYYYCSDDVFLIANQEGGYEAIGNPVEGFRGADDTDAIAYFPVDIEATRALEINKNVFLNGDNSSFANLEFTQRSSLTTPAGSEKYFTIVDNVDENYARIVTSVERANYGYYNKDLSNDKVPYTLEQSVALYSYNNVLDTYQPYDTSYMIGDIVSTPCLAALSEMVDDNGSVDTSVIGLRDVKYYYDEGKYANYQIKVFDLENNPYEQTALIAGSNIEGVPCDGYIVMKFTSEYSKADIIDKLVGNYLAVTNILNGEKEYVPITRDMIKYGYLNTDQVGQAYIYIAYKGVVSPIRVKYELDSVDAPYLTLNIDASAYASLDMLAYDTEDSFGISALGKLVVDGAIKEDDPIYIAKKIGENEYLVRLTNEEELGAAGTFFKLYENPNGEDMTLYGLTDDDLGNAIVSGSIDLGYANLDATIYECGLAKVTEYMGGFAYTYYDWYEKAEDNLYILEEGLLTFCIYDYGDYINIVFDFVT